MTHIKKGVNPKTLLELHVNLNIRLSGAYNIFFMMGSSYLWVLPIETLLTFSFIFSFFNSIELGRSLVLMNTMVLQYQLHAHQLQNLTFSSTVTFQL